MTKINTVLASGTVAMLLMSAPFLASAYNGTDKGNGAVKDTAKVNLSIQSRIDNILHGTPIPGHATTSVNGKMNVSAVVTAINGSVLTVNAKNGTTYTVNASNAVFSGENGTNASLAQVKVGDTLHIKGTVNGSTITAEKITDAAIMVRSRLAANGAAGAGVVTSVSGNTFTIKPFGTKATTTVATSASTVYRVNGELASSSDLTVGDKVVVAGSVNSDTSIVASIVGIFSKGFGFFKHHLWF